MLQPMRLNCDSHLRPDYRVRSLGRRPVEKGEKRLIGWESGESCSEAEMGGVNEYREVLPATYFLVACAPTSAPQRAAGIRRAIHDCFDSVLRPRPTATDAGHRR